MIRYFLISIFIVLFFATDVYTANILDSNANATSGSTSTGGTINFEAGEIQLLLFDILGKPIKVFNFYMSSDYQVLDISDIPSGVYFVRIDDKERVIIRRLVKK